MESIQRLTAEAAVQYLRALGLQTCEATLAKLRCTGGGPRFIKCGRAPIYTPAWLDEYADSRTSGVKTSTSDPGSKAA